MGRNGEGGAPSGSNPECCMCGDHGLSSELFTCKNCRFRSQHKYCSNLYPGAESYHICNWCLSQTDDKTREGNTKPSPNSSHKTTSDHHQDDDSIKMNKKKRVLVDNHGDRRTTTSSQIKKQIKVPEAADRHRAGPSSAGRKRVTSDHHGGIAERIIRRTRSDVISNGGNGMIIKQVFRHKVRRYKLLDEVSS